MKVPVFICIVSILCVPFFSSAQTIESGTAADVDIIIEADTLVPAFYNGRREPSGGSIVRAVAVTSTPLAGDGHTYRWELNGQMRGAADNAIEFSTPIGNSFRIRVDVLNANGQRVATDEQIVQLQTPRLLFYENNLLRGASHIALGERYILSGDEVSVHAEPYFVDRDIFTNPHQLTWRVNGRNVTEQTDGQQNITLRRASGSGSSLVAFSLYNAVSFAQRADGEFTLVFNQP